jgi:hypothetical protein
MREISLGPTPFASAHKYACVQVATSRRVANIRTRGMRASNWSGAVMRAPGWLGGGSVGNNCRSGRSRVGIDPGNDGLNCRRIVRRLSILQLLRDALKQGDNARFRVRVFLHGGIEIVHYGHESFLSLMYEVNFMIQGIQAPHDLATRLEVVMVCVVVDVAHLNILGKYLEGPAE